MDMMPSNTFFFFAVIYLPSESVCMRVYSVSVLRFLMCLLKPHVSRKRKWNSR